MKPILKAENICKYFGDLKANDKINIDFYPNEIHVVLGENGAGKTTLMNIIYGMYQPDAGSVYLHGKQISCRTPKDAIRLGIGMVHQHFKLVPNLSVAENIVLGEMDTAVIHYKKINAEVRDLADRFGVDMDPACLVSELPIGLQQQVEILKCLYRNAKLLILDEPTSVLTPQEIEAFFKTLVNLRQDGKSIVLITHKMEEVMAISDRITVLRDGSVIKTLPREEADREMLSRMMVGREIKFTAKQSKYLTDVVLELKDVRVEEKERVLVKNISFSLHRGEVLGVAGVSGNGQKELVEVISGLRKASSGEIRVNGRNTINSNRRKAFENKIAHVPEDRQKDGLVLDLPVLDNSILGTHYKEPFSKNLRLYNALNFKEIRKHVNSIIQEYSVKAKNANEHVRHLSGGHQQRLILGRELNKLPDLVIADKPTQGLDIAATEFIRSKLIQICLDGAAVLLVSNELDEIFSLADHIMVMYRGENMGIFPRDGISIEKLGLLMMGSSAEEILQEVHK